ncbi:PREDICTED: serine carboxypeptidase-like 50 [Nicotiana attenuata]|uniref:Carboxypeptidase n=1 Tax=Nicotiana attenuata TaxID=49451 RepID=A0A1J6I8L6_NICAT|nr:PREDICTED: serine carboxypeptidase-like 50 [Nicotiana attenuata]OIT01318.1 serine carboxypeptidase-like 50 [Nicotiana attenuata]
MESRPKPLPLFMLFYCLSSAIITVQSSFPKEALPTKSGYLTVNSTTGSAIFYTFYEAQKSSTKLNLSETPILIWLQGGPGCSSMLGNFYELGPYRVSSSFRHNVEHLSLEPNPGSWNRIFGLLFLDNPIGTGFSIASSQDEIPRNLHDVARHLFTATREFIALDPLFKTRPIYLTGESYAGKYVPAFGYYTLKKNAGLPKSRRLNLAGIAIGNGLTDPETQVGTHALSAYYSGLINEKQKTQLESLQKEAIRLTKNGNWSAATSARSRVLGMLTNMTGLATLYDFRRLKPYEDELVAKFLSNVDIKRALKANDSIAFEVCSDSVGKALHEDVMKSVKYMVEFLVKNTKVLLYQGQCDLRDGVVSTEAWMKKMKWDGIEKFLEAERKVWRVNDGLAGYVQKWESLSHVVVMNAGHLVPTDQAVNSQVMIEDWVLEKGLFATGQIKQKPSNIDMPQKILGNEEKRT